jgi:hypothetical protein
MLLLRPLEKVLKRVLLSLQAKNEVARFEGIILSDSDSNVSFRETVLGALQLIKDLDPRRFQRIQKYVKWIVNVPLAYGGGEYSYSMRTCRLDFERSVWEPHANYASALCARMLVHEATHGVINARRIPYSSQLRSQIERLCVREEQRFLSLIAQSQPQAARAVWPDFDESQWHKGWTDSRSQSLSAIFMRLSRYMRTQREHRRLIQP